MDTPDYLNILIPSVIGLAATILVAYFSARWGVRHAFEERWWDRKEKAYTDILNALYEIIRYSDLNADMSEEADNHPNRNLWTAAYSSALERIRRVSDIGAFVISDKTAKILDKLKNAPELDMKNIPPWEYFENEAKKYREALAGIRACALKDLKIKRLF